MKAAFRWVALFLRLSRPHFLLGGFLLYGLGGAVAYHLGLSVDPGLYAIGQALVTTTQLMTHFLNEYYDAPVDQRNPNRSLLTGGSGALGPTGLPRTTALFAAIGCLTLAASLASLLLVQGRGSLLAWIVLLLGFLGAFSYNAPPLSLISTGYGEVVSSIVVAGLVPTFAFALQAGRLERLLLLTLAPLVALHFAMLLAFELPDFGSDAEGGKRTLTVRLGCMTAMRLHDLAIITAAIALVAAIASGVPTRVGLGALIVLPLGLAQLWQTRRLRLGFPPRWRTLTLFALVLFGLTAYLELVGFLLA